LYVFCVSPHGNINNDNYNNDNNGVRPFWWNASQSREYPKSVHHIKRTCNHSLKKDKQKGLYCMTDFEKVINFENMYRAYRKSKSGKGYQKSSAKFNLMALEGGKHLD